MHRRPSERIKVDSSTLREKRPFGTAAPPSDAYFEVIEVTDMTHAEGSIEGLSYYPAVITEEQERTLLRQFDDMAFHNFVMRGMTSRRSIVCFGYDYEYKRRSVVPMQPIPACLEFIKERCSAVAGVPDTFDQVIVSCYPAGAGIGWHTDSPVFDDVILGLSISSPARLQLRRRNGSTTTASLVISPRSLYVLRGSARWDWQHRVPPVSQLRYSLTFRTVTRHGQSV